MKPHAPHFLLAPCLLALSLLLPLPSSADQPPYLNSAPYAAGLYGAYPHQTFRSSPLVAPLLNFHKPFSACDDGAHLFIAPRGAAADPYAGPMILDAQGSLVWAAETSYGRVYNFMAQQYLGQPVLTFWAGNDAVGGHGVGFYYVLDQNYNQLLKLQGAHGLGADLHCFTITPDSTTLSTLYEAVERDLTGVRQIRNIKDDKSFIGKEGREVAEFYSGTGFIWDALFQEIDPTTGTVLFEWRASDHINLNASFTKVASHASAAQPWDFFHINMVDKDALGNYLVSARHLRAVLYIDGASGEVLWQLGGKNNSFRDLSDGAATAFIGQHDAHWVPASNRTAITLFNNGADWADSPPHAASTGLRIAVDLIAMTATLAQTFALPDAILSNSQGSCQTLPSGNVLLGYGANGAMAEFDGASGELLCEAAFEARSRFGHAEVQSYRNLKFAWTGMPGTVPRVVVDGGALFVSWNGATEVRAWGVEDAYFADGGEEGWRGVRVVEKGGFETEVGLGGAVRRFVRVVALDSSSQRRLAVSAVLDLGVAATEWETGAEAEAAAAAWGGREDWGGDEEELDIADDDADADADVADDDDELTEAKQQTSAYRQEIENLETLAALGFLVVVLGVLAMWIVLECGRHARYSIVPWRLLRREEEEEAGMAETEMKLACRDVGSGGGGSGRALWSRLRVVLGWRRRRAEGVVDEEDEVLRPRGRAWARSRSRSRDGRGRGSGSREGMLLAGVEVEDGD
ncbi:hypothetical protein LTR08_001551 [Meristemomyces frigidus]|nr:hypothetical protein LTR08_001551 [Meristemomyces frigidus]